jgi:hypothetical protein
MRVKILKDPCGLYNMSYYPGEVIDLPDGKAKEMIETGHAERTTEKVGHNYEGFVFTTEAEKALSKVKTEKR